MSALPQPQPRHSAVDPACQSIRVERRGVVDYGQAWEAMKTFTSRRGTSTPDQLWLLQHPPVYTLGVAGDAKHLLRRGDIPLVRSDRGGQITYHGPGQLIAYALLDLRRLGLGVRELVRRLESAVLALLADHGVGGERRAGAPGVYVGGAKLASVGLRIRNGCSYHGLALNVAMALEPFAAINPCGYAGLPVTQLRDLAACGDLDEVGENLVNHLRTHLEPVRREP